MPTYDYVCNSCGNEFEKFQKMSDDPVRICPQCGQESVEKIIGAGAGILFKGSGFYVTDYRSDSYQKSAAKENGTDKKAGDQKGKAKDSQAATTSGAAK